MLKLALTHGLKSTLILMKTLHGTHVSELKGDKPVFVWAVEKRCGTGLLQRLLTSSEDVFIFGELHLFARYLPSTLSTISVNEDEIRESTQKLADGDYSHWCPNALPRPEQVNQTIIANFFNWVEIHKATASQHGFSRWGLKLPIFDRQLIRIIQQLLPSSKHLCLYRDVHDVLKSNKARGFVDNVVESHKLCTQWAAKVKSLLDSDNENLLPVKFEELLDNQKEQTDRICRFANLEPVDLDVFEHKVNTWQDEADSDESYVEPEPLTEQEEQLISQLPQELMEAAGYSFRK